MNTHIKCDCGCGLKIPELSKFQPPKVVAHFAYYNQSFHDIPSMASYIILESDNPKLPVNGNVSGEQLLEAGVPLPLTPTFQSWLNMGKPIYRGE